LRTIRGPGDSLPLSVAKLERLGLPLVEALRKVMLDPALFQHERAAAGKLLAISGDKGVTQTLLKLFFEQSQKDDLYVTALTLEELNDRRALPILINALLEDSNPHRRHAAARALGWIRPSNRATARALARCLVDPTQPQPAREEAAESLAYAGTRETVDPIISVFGDPDVRIRFWAVFGLGGSCRGDARAIKALESILDDDETPPGNWWSVGKEALAMLAALPPVRDRYEARLATETQRILSDPNATEEDRRWAWCYDYSRSVKSIDAGAQVIALG
jgi:HEAT repeat protein